MNPGRAVQLRSLTLGGLGSLGQYRWLGGNTCGSGLRKVDKRPNLDWLRFEYDRLGSLENRSCWHCTCNAISSSRSACVRSLSSAEHHESSSLSVVQSEGGLCKKNIFCLCGCATFMGMGAGPFWRGVGVALGNKDASPCLDDDLTLRVGWCLFAPGDMCRRLPGPATRGDISSPACMQLAKAGELSDAAQLLRCIRLDPPLLDPPTSAQCALPPCIGSTQSGDRLSGDCWSLGRWAGKVALCSIGVAGSVRCGVGLKVMRENTGFAAVGGYRVCCGIVSSDGVLVVFNGRVDGIRRGAKTL